MMQDYCRYKVLRGIRDVVRVLEECGRVLRTDGHCDNVARHRVTADR